MGNNVKEIMSQKLRFLERPVFQLAKRRWKIFIYVTILSSFASFVSMIIPFVAKMLIDQLGENFSFAIFSGMSLLLICAIFFKTFISVVIIWITTQLRYSLVRELLEEIYSKILSLSPSQISQFQSGTLTMHILNDVEMLITGIESLMTISIRYPLEYIGLLGVLLYISPLLCLIFLCAGLIIALFSILKSKQLGSSQLSRNKAKASLFGTVNENIGFLKIIRAFDRIQHRIGLFRDQFQDLVTLEKKLVFSQAVFNLLSDALVAFFVFIALLFIGIQLSSGQQTPGSVAAALVALVTISSSLSKYSRALGNLKASMYAGGYIEEIIRSSGHNKASHSTLTSFRQPITDITVRNLAFSHELQPIFEQVNFTAKQGVPIILMGENGAGKSTIIDILFGLYQPSAGEVFFNERTMRSINKSDILNRMALVPQVPAIFSESIEYNLHFGNPLATKEEIDHVVRETGISLFLENKGCGLDYNVGDRGNTLSPGEMQRISLARALLRKPDVLVMDEPTNNLDEQTIKIIWQVIFDYAKEHIVLIVSHVSPPNLGRVRIIQLRDGKLHDSTEKNHPEV